MQDVTTLYDDLIAIRRTADVLPETAREVTRCDLEVALQETLRDLSAALRALPEEERHDIMYELDCENAAYGRGAWAELSRLP